MNSYIFSESDAAPKASPIQNPVVDSGPGFVRLKTKQKKLLRKALREGITREKAIQIVQAIPNENGLLRAPYKFRDIVNPTNGPFSSVVRFVRLGFASESDGTMLTSEQLSRIQEAIIDVTVEHAGGEMPQFEKCVARKGWLMVICANFSTSQWLKRNFCHIQAKVEFKLKLMTEEELPRKNVIRGYFPDSLSTGNQKVLDIIEAQNPVSTTEWRVLKRLTYGELLHLVISVDNESQKKLVDLDGIISFRFGRLKFSMKEDKETMIRKQSLKPKEKPIQVTQPLQKVTPPLQKVTPPLQKVTASQAAVPVVQNPSNCNNGQWLNYNGMTWNTYYYPWTQWGFQSNYSYIPPNPKTFSGPGFSESGAWVGTNVPPPPLGNS
uniref:Uncharacterized protein LOC108050881 n=1 Tax=Drosophila rhopaloa TaxID=1041015 RepID=A0A6P4FDV9_DRORH